MGHYWRALLASMSVLAVLLLPGSLQAGWRERLQEVRDKWKESERRCVDCGKLVHGRDRCATCEMKRLAEQARQKVEEARKRWEESQRHCSDCGKVIHGRERCLECEARRASARAREISQQAADGLRAMKRSWEENKEAWKAKVQDAVQRSAQEVQRVLRDPERRKHVLEKAAAMQHQVELTIIRHVPVVDPATGQLTTFDRMMRQMVEGTGIGGDLGKDPVGTAFLMLVDSDYLLNTARVIQGPSGGYLTLNEALLVIRDAPGVVNEAALKRAADSYARLRLAYQNSDANTLTAASREFAEAIAAANSRLSPEPDHRHLIVWAGFDAGLFAVATFFQDAFRFLTARFQEWKIPPQACPWLATAALGMACLVALWILRAILCAGLKHKLRVAQAELQRLKGATALPREAPSAGHGR